jgi:hypothetical protein
MGLHHTKVICSFNLLQLLNKVRDEMGVLNGQFSPKFFVSSLCDASISISLSLSLSLYCVCVIITM